MRKTLPQTSPSSSDIYGGGNILANWLVAVTKLYECYHQLSAHIDQTFTKKHSSETYVGQSPVSHLTKLVTSMQHELEKLAQDMDQPVESGEVVFTKGYSKLVTHTQVLDQLNQQAQRALYLADCVAS